VGRSIAPACLAQVLFCLGQVSAVCQGDRGGRFGFAAPVFPDGEKHGVGRTGASDNLFRRVQQLIPEILELNARLL
jgi:hypothetical protein